MKYTLSLLCLLSSFTMYTADSTTKNQTDNKQDKSYTFNDLFERVATVEIINYYFNRYKRGEGRKIVFTPKDHKIKDLLLWLSQKDPFELKCTSDKIWKYCKKECKASGIATVTASIIRRPSYLSKMPEWHLKMRDEKNKTLVRLSFLKSYVDDAGDRWSTDTNPPSRKEVRYIGLNGGKQEGHLAFKVIDKKVFCIL